MSNFPIRLTETALKMAQQFKSEDPSVPPNAFLRVSVSGGGCSGFKYEVAFDDNLEEDDLSQDFSVNDLILTVVVDAFSLMYLKSVTIDYEKTEFAEGFKFLGNEQVKKTCGCGKSFSA